MSPKGPVALMNCLLPRGLPRIQSWNPRAKGLKGLPERGDLAPGRVPHPAGLGTVPAGSVPKAGCLQLPTLACLGAGAPTSLDPAGTP